MPLPLVLIFPLETLSAQPGAELFRRHDLPGNRRRLTLEFRCKVLTVKFTGSRSRNNGICECKTPVFASYHGSVRQEEPPWYGYWVRHASL